MEQVDEQAVAAPEVHEPAGRLRGAHGPKHAFPEQHEPCRDADVFEHVLPGIRLFAPGVNERMCVPLAQLHIEVLELVAGNHDVVVHTLHVRLRTPIAVLVHHAQE